MKLVHHNLRIAAAIPWLLFTTLLMTVRAENGIINLVSPATITNSGSYRITRDIVLQGGNPIEVKANNVTIDLNGHLVTADPIFFANDAAIYQYSGYNNLTVKNGTVVGGDGFGIKAEGLATRIIDVRIRETSGGALLLGNNALVTDCLVESNHLAGASYLIQAGENSIFERISVNDNRGAGLYGLYAGDNTIIKNLSVVGNCATSSIFRAVVTGDKSTITSCNIYSNNAATSFNGIETGSHSIIARSSVTHNHTTGGIITGIYAESGSQISTSIASKNSSGDSTARGFWLTSDGTIEKCVAEDNDATLSYGFYAESNILIRACTAYSNSGNGFGAKYGNTLRYCVAKANGGHGFYFGSDWNNVTRCLADNNTTTGFYVNGDRNRIKDCSAHDSATGFDINGVNNLITGCDGWNPSGNNFSIDAGNSYGTLEDQPGEDFSIDNSRANFELN